MSKGRWDAESLAAEMECSIRTVQRDLSTLTMAGVPVHYDAEAKAYRVPANFRYPGLDSKPSPSSLPTDPATHLLAAKRLIAEAERFTDALREFCKSVEG
jgi:predicted DNA-binding transcriptional regulator YafY